MKSCVFFFFVVWVEDRFCAAAEFGFACEEAVWLECQLRSVRTKTLPRPSLLTSHQPAENISDSQSTSEQTDLICDTLTSSYLA